MKLRVFQKGFNFSQDGPGNRLVYHLSGCSLSCPWCSNPEGKPHDGGREYEVEELVEEALRSRPMFFDGGGVTLTGGEVTEQFAALEALLTRLRQEKIHTCIETNGTHPRLPELFPLVDHLIMDIKHYDDSRHRQVIGISNRLILDNIRAAGALRQQLALRIPLIGGFNATLEDARGFGMLLGQLGVLETATLELLCYHEYGKDKYRSLGIPYPMTEAAKIPAETLTVFQNTLQDLGVRIITT